MVQVVQDIKDRGLLAGFCDACLLQRPLPGHRCLLAEQLKLRSVDEVQPLFLGLGNHCCVSVLPAQLLAYPLLRLLLIILHRCLGILRLLLELLVQKIHLIEDEVEQIKIEREFGLRMLGAGFALV